MAVDPPSPRPRRIANPSWLDLRLVLGIVLVVGSVLVGATIVSRARDTDPVVTVTRDLAGGTIVTAADVRIAQVQLPDHGAGVYVTRLRDAVGKRLFQAVTRGELLPSAAVTKVGTRTTVTIPLAASAAPQLRSGQRIKVWVSTTTCSSVVLLPDVTVQSVRVDQGSFGTGSGGQDVVINVAPDDADRVVAALAIDSVKLRAGVLAGPTASATPSDVAGQSPLPDISACASASR